MLRQSRSRADDLAMLVAMLPAGLAANALHGTAWPVNLGFSIINLLDMSAGLLAVRGLGMPRLRNWGAAARFTLVAAITPALVGGFFAGLLVALLGGNGRMAALQWFIANFLGVCILFPLGMTVSRRQLGKLKLANRGLEAALVFAAVAATAALTFHFAGFHMQFLVLVAAGAAAVRFRLLGAGAALLIIAAIALAAPVAHWSLMLIGLLQLFLAVSSSMTVRVAMLMNERDMHIAVIERGRRRAVRASRFKSQLLAHVSHEVRTPLSAVVGFSGMLETGALSAERAPEFAGIIVHNGELLRRLHDDLLDLSRAEAGALSLMPGTVRLSEAVFTCVGGIRLDTALGGKHLVVDPIAEGLAVRADPVRLAQIVNNLIVNAYKYGDSRSPIRISAAATRTASDASRSSMPDPASRRRSAATSSALSAVASAARFRAPAWACPSPSGWWKCRAAASISRACRARPPISGSIFRSPPDSGNRWRLDGARAGTL
jgi:signal transduction histidine kinase